MTFNFTEDLSLYIWLWTTCMHLALEILGMALFINVFKGFFFFFKGGGGGVVVMKTIFVLL
jgi:hypothetical protein